MANLARCPKCGANSSYHKWNQTTASRFYMGTYVGTAGYKNANFVCPFCGDMVKGEQLELSMSDSYPEHEKPRKVETIPLLVHWIDPEDKVLQHCKVEVAEVTPDAVLDAVRRFIRESDRYTLPAWILDDTDFCTLYRLDGGRVRRVWYNDGVEV